MSFTDQDWQAINAIRTLSIDAIEKANSGHPGLPLGAAPMAWVLWSRHLTIHPKHSKWPNRDRFVLSAGHGSMLLYSLLHLSGFRLSLDEIKNFRQWGSLTPGHPEYGLTEGVECTTGPLGQGAANAVGMALAEKHLSATYNQKQSIVDHFTYALISDGDVMEGVAQEAASLAGHLKLGKLICLYDANNITLDGSTDLCFDSEDVLKRYEAYGWHTQWVEDGDHDLEAIDQAIRNAKKESHRPSLIGVRTTIGFGSPKKAGSSDAHGSPLGKEEAQEAKKNFKTDHLQAFEIPKEIYEIFNVIQVRGEKEYSQWNDRFEKFKTQEPNLFIQWNQSQTGELPDHWDFELEKIRFDSSLASRKASGQVLNQLSKTIPWLVGGDADLSVSTQTRMKSFQSFSDAHPEGRNIHFGVREHAMGAIANGMAYHHGLKPYTATFFCFSDYMKAAIRLSAMNELPVIYVFTHDSVGLGEDGPTHQPIEHLAALRSIPNLTVFRPADAHETLESWKWAVQSKKTPVALVLSRQSLTTLAAQSEKTSQGAYVVSCSSVNQKEKVCLIATGSEVSLAIEVQKHLEKDQIATRVVSMPCWELFEAQDKAIQEDVLGNSDLFRVSIEAASTFGWDRWVGPRGLKIGLDRFGASAPGKVVFENLGFEPSLIAKNIQARLL